MPDRRRSPRSRRRTLKRFRMKTEPALRAGRGVRCGGGGWQPPCCYVLKRRESVRGRRAKLASRVKAFGVRHSFRGYVRTDERANLSRGCVQVLRWGKC